MAAGVVFFLCRVFVGQGSGSSGKAKKGSGGAKTSGGEPGMKQSEQKQVVLDDWVLRHTWHLVTCIWHVRLTQLRMQLPRDHCFVRLLLPSRGSHTSIFMLVTT